MRGVGKTTMFPEDRVLVGVLNRVADLEILRDQQWYRIPQQQLPHGVYAEYLAFFLSRAFKELNGGIHYFAERKGLELIYRRDLLPAETQHPRANEVYYKVQLGELQPKVPPVLNSTRRTISFIHTTWDRFVRAQEISDLYSRADYFVDRIYHALRNKGLRPLRFWETERKETGHGAQLRILCEHGMVVASPYRDDGEGVFHLNENQDDDSILAAIRAEILSKGGPTTVSIPVEGF